MIGAAGLLAALLTLSGCGDSKEGRVSGTVWVDDEPVEDGSINFIPADGQSQTAGGVIKDGKYSVKVPVGLMKVEIRAPKTIGHKKIYPDQPNSPVRPVREERLAERYNLKTELTFEVRPGDNEKDFRLPSKQRRGRLTPPD